MTLPLTPPRALLDAGVGSHQDQRFWLPIADGLHQWVKPAPATPIELREPRRWHRDHWCFQGRTTTSGSHQGSIHSQFRQRR